MYYNNLVFFGILLRSISVHFSGDQVLSNCVLRPKKCMCVSGFSSENPRYVRSALSFYFTKIFYIDNILHFSLKFPPFFSTFDYIVFRIHNRMLRVRAKA